MVVDSIGLVLAILLPGNMDCHRVGCRVRDGNGCPAQMVTGHVRNLILGLLHRLCERGG